MLVKDFVKLLLKCKQDNELKFKFNVIDDQDEMYDEEADAQVMTANSDDTEATIIILPSELKEGNDLDDALHILLDADFHNNDSIKIEIDLAKGIYIRDENNGLQRELDFSEEALTWSREERIRLSILKLRKML